MIVLCGLSTSLITWSFFPFLVPLVRIDSECTHTGRAMVLSGTCGLTREIARNWARGVAPTCRETTRVYCTASSLDYSSCFRYLEFSTPWQLKSPETISNNFTETYLWEGVSELSLFSWYMRQILFTRGCLTRKESRGSVQQVVLLMDLAS